MPVNCERFGRLKYVKQIAARFALQELFYTFTSNSLWIIERKYKKKNPTRYPPERSCWRIVLQNSLSATQILEILNYYKTKRTCLVKKSKMQHKCQILQSHIFLIYHESFEFGPVCVVGGLLRIRSMIASCLFSGLWREVCLCASVRTATLWSNLILIYLSTLKLDVVYRSAPMKEESVSQPCTCPLSLFKQQQQQQQTESMLMGWGYFLDANWFPDTIKKLAFLEICWKAAWSPRAQRCSCC